MASPPPRAEIPNLAQLDLTIPTSRLVLRPWRAEDLEDIWPVVSDPTFPRFMSWTAHASKAETRVWLEHAALVVHSNEEVKWAIERDGRAIGSIGFHDIAWQVRAFRLDRAELGYWLAPAAHRQGLMTEAVQAVVRYGFETIGLHKIAVTCMAENVSSRRVIEKAGFRWVGRAEDDVWRDGTWHAHLMYEITAPEWPDVHTTMRVARPKITS
ncbi:MAG TPA: GNAT family protein [Kofleriaceae bacterium]|nr:GNAT family protein [Kofleriaceae bacterium]